MYAIDERLRPPQDKAATIWRFLDFPKFVSMLEERTLHFTRADHFDDPFEGTWGVSPPGTDTTPWFGPPSPDLGSGGGRITRPAVEEEEPFVEEVGRLRRRTFINCWHVNEHEPASMWAQYVRQGAGVAIKSTVGQLIRALEAAPEAVRLSEVTYLDYDATPLLVEYPLARFIHKRMGFEHERELRAILDHEPHIGWRDIVATSISVDLGDLITELRVSPGAPQWIGGLIVSVAGRYDLKFPTRRSTLDDRPLY